MLPKVAPYKVINIVTYAGTWRCQMNETCGHKNSKEDVISLNRPETSNTGSQETHTLLALLHVIGRVVWPKHVKVPLWIVSGCTV